MSSAVKLTNPVGGSLSLVMDDTVTTDEVIEISRGTMTGTISNFTSTGIDDNATSTAITIDASENVGIGTSSPEAHLDISSDSLGDATALRFGVDDGTNYPRVTVKHKTSASGHTLEFDSGYSTGSGYANYQFKKGSLSLGEWLGKFHQIRNVNNWRYASGSSLGARYIHMKTNRSPTNESQMYSVTFRGHSYGETKPVNASLGWYNYAATNTVTNVGSHGTHTLGCYKSSDGYAVMTLYTSSHYYIAFTFDQFVTNQTLKELTITNTTTSASSTGVY